MSNKCPIPDEPIGKYDIYDRCLRFAIDVASFVDLLPNKRSAFEYGKQLIRSSASIGANMEEADGALSKKDFINKVCIARKEAKETGYWLKLIKYSKIISCDTLEQLLRESKEIKLILSSIINKTRGLK